MLKKRLYNDSFIEKTYNFLNTNNNNHFTEVDVITFFNINNKIDIFPPSIDTPIVSPFYAPFGIKDVFKNHRIYSPFSLKNSHSFLMHELSNALFYVLLQNNELPYNDTNYDMIESYKNAVNNTLTRVFLNFLTE